jgi:hypothetical protein
MPDKKNPSESPPETSIPLPDGPPKQPKIDYTTLPQKPITLKHEVKSPVVLKKAIQKAKRKTQVQKKPPAPPKRAPSKPAAAVNEWDLSGLSASTKEKALADARQNGLNLAEWIEQLVWKDVPSQSTTNEAETLISESLKSIDERLDRIENQKGFWVRFWDRFMEQR